MKYDVIVYIGRFQPAHHGHIATMRAALEQANRLVVVIGSHNTPRDIKNPWTSREREGMIRACLTSAENLRVNFVYAENRLYSNTFWTRNVERLVNGDAARYYVNPTIGIIGNGKGDKDTAEYVGMFKKWERVPASCVSLGNIPLNATKLRELYFTGHLEFVRTAIPDAVYKFLHQFSETDEYETLKGEYDFHIEEEKKYEHVPYGSYTRYTADAVVIQSGHILLIRRKNAPGKGLWALPGGHVNQDENAFECSLRELREETGINIQDEVLTRCLFDEKLFDHPERSMVGRVTKKRVRTSTVAYGYKLDDKRDLPLVRGKDDASDARWFTFDEFAKMRKRIYEDHADIGEYFLARVPEQL